MNKLPVYLSEQDFEAYILPHLSHKLGHNRLKVSYHYIFNNILYALKSGGWWTSCQNKSACYVAKYLLPLP